MASGYKNALSLLSEEDVPGASFVHAQLDKHSVDQLRRWDRGKTRVARKISIMKLPTLLRSHAWYFDSDTVSGDVKLWYLVLLVLD